MSVSATPHSPKPALRTVDPGCKSATASSASLKSFDFDRSIIGARSEIRRLWFVNLHCGNAEPAARSCAGTGRREQIREGSAASSRYDVGSVSIVVVCVGDG
jgi:hypothetical protein